MTANDGRFTLEHLVPGTWYFRAEAKGHLEGTTESPVSEDGENQVEIVMQKAWAGTLAGRVLMADGKTPVANTELTIDLLRRDEEYRGEEFGRVNSEKVNTDEEGRFTVEVRHAIHAAKVAPQGWLPITVEIEPSDRETETLTVQALRPATIRGRVEAGEAPIPREGLYVLAIRPGEYANMRHLDQQSYEQGHAKVMPGQNEFEIQGLETGEFEVFTYAEGLPPSAPKRVQLASGETAEVVVDVAAPGSVAGRVLAADGQPLAGARVYVYTSGGRVSASGPTAETDQQGGFQLDNLTPGLAHVRAYATGHAWTPSKPVTIVALDTVGDIEFRMLPGGSIAGTVRLADGTPPAGDYRVSVELELGRVRSAYLKPGGTFLIERIYPGTYRVLLQEMETGRIAAIREAVRVVNEETTEGIDFAIEE
jgi:hypothetical protein